MKNYNGDANSVKNQDIKSKFIDREVFANVNDMVNFILSDDNENDSAPFTFDDVENYYSFPEYNGKFASFDGGTEEERQAEIDRLNELLEVAANSKNIDQIQEEINELENLESEPQEVYEWWLVSSYLAERLKSLGHPVIDRSYGGHIWGRCTTGQAILLDYAISQICSDMEILEGQANEWKV